MISDLHTKTEEYENEFHKNSASNKAGIVYTDQKIADTIIGYLNPQMYESIWEPSVGGGAFIFSLIQYIQKTFNPSALEMKKYFEEKVFFSDIDENSLSFLINNLDAYFFKEYGIQNMKDSFNAYNEDGLNNKKQYDIIFGNPPYVRTKNIEESYLKEIRKNFISCASGNIDLYYAFVQMAYQHSSRMCFIVPNSYLSNRSADTLRGLIEKDVSIIIDFKEKHLFEGAAAYTSILMTKKDDNETFLYSVYGTDFSELSKSKLIGRTWNFDQDNRALAFEERDQHLTDIANINSGIATLSDKSFIVENDTLEDGFFKKTFNGHTFLIEEGICISLKKLTKLALNQSIIFPYIRTSTIMPEDMLISLYPMAYEYLSAIREEVLNNRDKGKTSDYDAWYAYGRRQGINVDFTGKDAFLVPLTYKEDDFNFRTIKESSRFIHSSGYVIVPKEGYYDKVLEVLNSHDFFEFLDIKGKKMPGTTNFNRVSATILKEYPLPKDKGSHIPVQKSLFDNFLDENSEIEAADRKEEIVEKDWNSEASKQFKSFLAREGIHYNDIVEALEKKGDLENYSSIAGKAHRGTFSFSFLLKCLDSLDFKIEISKKQ